EGTVVGLIKIAGVSARQRRSEERRVGGEAVGQGGVLSRAGGGDLLVAKRQGTGREGDRRGRPCPAQAHRLRAAGGVVDNAYCRAPRARRRGGERHREGAGPIDGQGGGAEGAVVGLIKVAAVSARQRDAADGQWRGAAVGQGSVLSWAGGGDLLVAKRQRTGREGDCRGRPCPAQAHRLRAAGGVVGNAYCRVPGALPSWGERHCEGAGPIDSQGGG